MNKRITSIMLSLIMLFTMLATAVPVLAATPVELKVTADTTSANPGDTINYKVFVGAVTNMGGLEFRLNIPSGLTIVDGSISIPTGLETTIDSDGAIVVPKSGNGYKWSYSAQMTGYTGSSDLVILNFACTVDDGASGDKIVTINVDTFFDNDPPYPELDYTVTPATVNVTVPHTHVYDQEVATAEHLKTAATCTAAAVYYKSCTCGENGTETFTFGSALGHDYTKKVENNTYLKTAASNCTEYNVYWYACSRCDANAKDDAAATDKYYTSTTAGNHSFTEKIEDAAHHVAGTGTDCQSVKQYYYDCAYCDQMGTATWDSTTYGAHTEGTEWKFDENNHWHICTVAGCGVVIESSKAAHTPDREAATETDPIKCSVCDYIITPALGMQDYIVEMPVSIAVKLTGDKKPAKETFKFEIYDLGVEDAEFEIVKDGITVENLEFDENGVAFAGGIIKIKVTGEDQLSNLTEGFSVRMVKGSTKGWTYASEQWRIEPFFENDALNLVITVKEIVDGEISEEYANGMSFAVSYEAVSEPDPTEPDPTEPDPTESGTTEPSKPADPQSPQTGDNSMMGLWIALLFVSGVGVVGTTIYSRKKKYTVK